MKKILAYIFLTIIIVLTVVYLVRYKRGLVFENKIPNSVTKIIHVNARQIEHHFLTDAISNPSKYIKFKFPEKDRDSIKLKNTISIPRNLFFYSNETMFKDGWFSNLIEVKKVTRLSQYLIREGFNKNEFEDILLFGKNNFILALKDKRLLIAYKKEKETVVVTAIKSIFDEVNFLSKDAELLKPIINSGSDVSYATNASDFLEGNFKNGLFEILGTFHSDAFLSAEHETISENVVGHVTAKIDKDHELFQALITEKNSTKFNELTKLSVDSITSKWNGNVAFNLKAISKKIDTIVTYDYDDDFNKIEKKSVQELIVPDLDFQLESHSGLFKYLSHKNAIQVVESDTIFTTIPLYKLYAHSDANTLKVSTSSDFTKLPIEKNYHKLRAYFNVEKYVENPLDFSLPVDNKYIPLFKDASIKYANNDQLSVKLILKDSDRNFIAKLIKP